MSDCDVCERSTATGYAGGVAHCHTCHRTWTNRSWAHCSVCHQTFGGDSAAKLHWTRRGHVHPSEVPGLRLKDDGVWSQPAPGQRVRQPVTPRGGRRSAAQNPSVGPWKVGDKVRVMVRGASAHRYEGRIGVVEGFNDGEVGVSGPWGEPRAKRDPGLKTAWFRPGELEDA